MIENGADVNVRDEGENKLSPLIYAIKYGWKDVVRLLIEKGADINAKDEGLKK